MTFTQAQKNSLAKLKREANQRAEDKGHKLGKFKEYIMPNGQPLFVAQCSCCIAQAGIVFATDAGCHEVRGPALTILCRNH